METNLDKVGQKALRTYLRRTRDVRSESAPTDRAIPQRPGGDQVSLSSRGQEIQRVRAHLRELPDVRREKVEAIRRQIEQGTYRVSAEAVAEKVLEAYRAASATAGQAPEAPSAQ